MGREALGGEGEAGGAEMDASRVEVGGKWGGLRRVCGDGRAAVGGREGGMQRVSAGMKGEAGP